MDKKENNTSKSNLYEVVETDSRIDSKWLSYVSSNDKSLIYHHPSYLSALEAESGGHVKRVVCLDNNGNIRGIIPFQLTKGMYMKIGGLFGSPRISSLPRTPYADAITDGYKITKLIINHLINKTKKEPNYKLQIKTYSPELYEGINELSKFPYYETYILEMPTKIENLRFGSSRNHRRIKWAINKATKSGVTVRLAESEDDLKSWYKLYSITRCWHGSASRSFVFFQTLWHLMKDKGLLKLLLAESRIGNKRRIIAGSLFFVFNNTVYYAFNGRDMRFLNLRPNDFLQWEAIHQAFDEGVKYYNMGGVEIGQKGLADFKTKWGCNSKQIFHLYASHQVNINHLNHEEGYSGGIKKYIWRSLPLTVTEILSNHINKRL